MTTTTDEVTEAMETMESSLANYTAEETFADEPVIPAYTHDCLVRWVLYGEPGGHFITAVLTNNLRDSFGRADERNRQTLGTIIRWLYNKAPRGSWGSEEAVNEWRRIGGYRGLISGENGDSDE